MKPKRKYIVNTKHTSRNKGSAGTSHENNDTQEKYRHEAAASHIRWRSLHEEGPPHDITIKIDFRKGNENINFLKFLLLI